MSSECQDCLKHISVITNGMQMEILHVACFAVKELLVLLTSDGPCCKMQVTGCATYSILNTYLLMVYVRIDIKLYKLFYLLSLKAFSILKGSMLTVSDNEQ